MVLQDGSPKLKLTVGEHVKVSFLAWPGWLVSLVIDLGFAAIEVREIEDVEEAFEGFRLHDEPRIRHTCFAFALSEEEPGGRVVYRDKQVELRMSRQDYDAASRAMTALVPDAQVQRVLAGAYEALAAFESCERPMAQV